jgi:hypothetical protein
MTAEPTTTPTTTPAASWFLSRVGRHLAPRFGAPGSISLAVTALRRSRRQRA